MVPFQATCEFCACAEWSSKNSDPQREVSLSLSPLTLSILFVRYCCRNHNQTRANVKLQWADPKRSNFQPRFLNHSIEDLKEFTSSTKLAMELVATKPIRQGEEAFWIMETNGNKPGKTTSKLGSPSREQPTISQPRILLWPGRRGPFHGTHPLERAQLPNFPPM